MKSKLHARRAFWPGAISTLLVAFVLAMLGATPAFAHHPEFKKGAECNADGTWNGWFEAEADAVRGLNWWITSLNASEWTPSGSISDAQKFFKWVYNIPNSTASVSTGNVAFKWSNNATGSGSATVSRPAGCNIPTATPIPPTDTPEPSLTPEPLPVAQMSATAECLAAGWRSTFVVTSNHLGNNFQMAANAEDYDPTGWQSDTGAFTKTTEVLSFVVPAYFEVSVVEWDNASQTMQGVSAMATRPENCVAPTLTPEPTSEPSITPEPTVEPTATDPAPTETPSGGDGTGTPEPSLTPEITFTPSVTLVASLTPSLTATAHPTEHVVPGHTPDIPVYACDNVEVPYDGTELQYTTGDGVWHFGAYLNAGRLVLAQGSAPHGSHFRLVYGGIVLVEFVMNQGQCEWAQTFSQVTATPPPPCPECDEYVCEESFGENLVTPYWDWKLGTRFQVRSTQPFEGSDEYIDVNGATQYIAHRLTSAEVLEILQSTETEFVFAGELRIKLPDGSTANANSTTGIDVLEDLLEHVVNGAQVQLLAGQCSICQVSGSLTRVVEGRRRYWVGYGGTPYDLALALIEFEDMGYSDALETAKMMYRRFHTAQNLVVASGERDAGYRWVAISGEVQ